MIVENEQIIGQVTIVSGFSRSVQHEIKIIIKIRATSLVGGCYWTISVYKDTPAFPPGRHRCGLSRKRSRRLEHYAVILCGVG